MANGHFSGCTSDSLKECWCEAKRYIYALGVVTSTFVVQALGGWWFNSLALLADAAHLATDILAYGIALYIVVQLRQASVDEQRLRRKGMVWTVLLLVLALGSMLPEAISRFSSPVPVNGLGMMGIAAVGAFGNLLQHRIVIHGESHDTTHGLVIHILTDLVSSIGIIVAAGVLTLTGLRWIDALATMCVVVWATYRSFRLLMGDGDHEHSH